MRTVVEVNVVTVVAEVVVIVAVVVVVVVVVVLVIVVVVLEHAKPHIAGHVCSAKSWCSPPTKQSPVGILLPHPTGSDTPWHRCGLYVVMVVAVGVVVVVVTVVLVIVFGREQTAPLWSGHSLHPEQVNCTTAWSVPPFDLSQLQFAMIESLQLWIELSPLDV